MEMGFALLPFYSKKKAFVHVKRWWVRTCTFRVEPGDVSFSRTTCMSSTIVINGCEVAVPPTQIIKVMMVMKIYSQARTQ